MAGVPTRNELFDPGQVFLSPSAKYCDFYAARTAEAASRDDDRVTAALLGVLVESGDDVAVGPLLVAGSTSGVMLWSTPERGAGTR